MNSVSDIFSEVVSYYTRAEALIDGELVDVTPMAKEVGFKISVAVTCTVWDKYMGSCRDTCKTATQVTPLYW